MSYTFGKSGGINYLKSLKDLKLLEFAQDLITIPVEKYDLIINDFEPLTAWASHKKQIPSISISHQASFLSSKTPRPQNRDEIAELIFQKFAPCQRSLAFHYDRYDDFIYTPIMRDDIRHAEVSKNGHITVYLPAFDEKRIRLYLEPIKDINWHIFSRERNKTHTDGHITWLPISGKEFVQSAASSSGMILASGFESTSEALFLGKKLLTIPMKGQYEQACNAVALSAFGTTVSETLSEGFTELVADWLQKPHPDRISFKEKKDILLDVIFTGVHQPAIPVNW